MKLLSYLSRFSKQTITQCISVSQSISGGRKAETTDKLNSDERGEVDHRTCCIARPAVWAGKGLFTNTISKLVPSACMQLWLRLDLYPRASLYPIRHSNFKLVRAAYTDLQPGLMFFSIRDRSSVTQHHISRIQ